MNLDPTNERENRNDTTIHAYRITIDEIKDRVKTTLYEEFLDSDLDDYSNAILRDLWLMYHDVLIEENNGQ